MRLFLTPGARFSERVFHASLWTFALRATLRLSTFARTIVLARILAPHDFGLIGIILLSTYLLETLTQTGFRTALIQRKGDIRPYLDSAWTIEALRGLALAGLLALLAPAIAGFFGAPETTRMLQVIALSVLISGLHNICIVYFQRDLELQKRFIYKAVHTVLEVGVTIALALVLKSAWAFVYGVLIAGVGQFIVSYLLYPYLPRVVFEWSKVREMYRFGVWVLLGQAVTFVALRFDSLFVGRLLGTASLGIYEVGQRLPDAVRVEMREVAHSVAFPAFSRIQEDSLRLRWSFYRSLEIVAFLIFPFAGALVVLAPEITRYVFGEKWLAAVPVIQVLAAANALRAVQSASEPLLFGIGRPRFSFQLNLFRAVALGIIVYPFIVWWGINGAAWAVLLSVCCVIPPHIFYSQTALNARARDLIKPLLLPTLLAAGMTLSYVGLKEAVGIQGLLDLIIVLAAGLVVYAACLVVFWRIFKTGPLHLAFAVWNRTLQIRPE